MASTKTPEQKSIAAAQKLARDSDAAKAMREYEAEKIRIDANTERLRALRLEKEAADAKAAAEAVVAKPKATKRKKAAAAV